MGDPYYPDPFSGRLTHVKKLIAKYGDSPGEILNQKQTPEPTVTERECRERERVAYCEGYADCLSNFVDRILQENWTVTNSADFMISGLSRRYPEVKK